MRQIRLIIDLIDLSASHLVNLVPRMLPRTLRALSVFTFMT
jgi:hypothetical protein